MKRFFVFILFGAVFGLNLLKAQFQTGIAGSMQAGVMGVTINPANSNYLNNGTDFMPFSFNAFMLNNDFYLPPKPVTSLVNGQVISAITSNDKTSGETISQKFQRIFNLKRSLKPNGYIFVGADIYGPSFLSNFGKHSIGLISAFKTASYTTNLPPELAIFLQKGIGTNDLAGKTFGLNGANSGTMVYTDIALNYSYQIRNSYKSIQRLGINLHYLTGINSIVFEDAGTTKWTIGTDSVVTWDKTSFRYNYAATKTTALGELLSKRGAGFGFDIGYTYCKKFKNRPTRTTYCPNIRYGGRVREFQTYKWKFGVSLMDIGFIKFNYQTITNTITNGYGNIDSLDHVFYSGVFALNRSLYYGLAGNPGVSYVRSTEFTQFLATRVNVQFDYLLKGNWFINFAMSQRIPVSPVYQMHAPNIVSLTARYQTLKYEIGIPVNLIEYQYPIIGFNFRYGPIFMGTNHLPELVGLRDIKGLDLYFGLKFNISHFKGV